MGIGINSSRIQVNLVFNQVCVGEEGGGAPFYSTGLNVPQLQCTNLSSDRVTNDRLTKTDQNFDHKRQKEFI